MEVLRFADVASKGLAGKRVFIRADLNVPQDHSAAGGGRITEDTRIRASVPCIQMAPMAIKAKTPTVPRMSEPTPEAGFAGSGARGSAGG